MPVYRALLFDLFRTVLFFTPRAPTGQVHEPHWRDAMRAQRPEFEKLLPAAEVEAFLDALVAASDDVAAARAPEYREVPIAERYRRAVLRLGYAEARAAELAPGLADVQLRAQVENAVLPPDHAETLDALKPRVKLGLVSNFDHGPAGREVLAIHGLDRRFDVIVFSIDINRRKPHAEIFEHALHALAVSPRDALFIGDTPREDVGGAAAVGMDTAWLNTAGRAWPDASPPPTYTLHHLRDLLPIA
jgi:HAD superfamily hydrolase (TIGR01509 family)